MTGITVQQAIDELAYYDKIHQLEDDLNFQDHFLGQIDKDAVVGAGESMTVGDTNFISLLCDIRCLNDFPGAPYASH